MPVVSLLLLGCVDTSTTPTSTPTGETGASTTLPAWSGPELALQDCAGELRDLASLRGPEGLVMAIGASWCGPCQDDAPAIEVFSRLYDTIGVVQVLVQDEDAHPATRLACEQWVDTFQLTHPVVVDPAFLTTDLAGDEGFPVHVAWLADGTQVFDVTGPFDADAVLGALGAR